MRMGLFGSTAIAGSFCGAPAASTFTVTAGAATDVPSSGLERTYVGVIGGANGLGAAIASLASASSSRNADARRYKPSVARIDAILPANVVMSNVGEDEPGGAADTGVPTAIRAKPTTRNTIGTEYLIPFPHGCAPYRRGVLNPVAAGRFRANLQASPVDGLPRLRREVHLHGHRGQGPGRVDRVLSRRPRDGVRRPEQDRGDRRGGRGPEEQRIGTRARAQLVSERNVPGGERDGRTRLRVRGRRAGYAPPPERGRDARASGRSAAEVRRRFRQRSEGNLARAVSGADLSATAAARIK